MRLAITHSEPGDAEMAPGAAVWRTCLREVRFSNAVKDADNASARVELVDADAYRLLLEILCGLQSPMLGETQVMGQFKAFLSTLDGTHGWLARLGQRLLADARDIRTRHLQGLGSRSYGSAVRRHLSGCSHAALIGTGKLAQEVLPFLADDGRAVDQWGRRELDTVGAYSASPMVSVLVIAAPAASDLVNRVIHRYPSLSQVIDLRGELDRTPLETRARVVTLQELFAEMTAANAFAVRHVDAARADIAACSRRYEMRDELRPFGWDDLCA